MANASDHDIQDFAAMSAALTGFQVGFLKPPLDTKNLARTYLEYATQASADHQATMQTLLTAYRAVAAQPPQQIANTLLETSAQFPSPQALLAQCVVKLWYTGSWYQPGSGVMYQVVSSLGYTSGLAWQVMQSHAMGFSPFSFGYWSQEPGPLSQFGVDTGSSTGGTK
jgi:hypothetical protein